MPFGNDENVPISAESVKQGLAEVSARDKIWDVHKAQADNVKGVYETVSEFERYALRIGNCSGILRFGRVVDTETGDCCSVCAMPNFAVCGIVPFANGGVR